VGITTFTPENDIILSLKGGPFRFMAFDLHGNQITIKLDENVVKLQKEEDQKFEDSKR
jgi:hypothetical protein